MAVTITTKFYASSAWRGISKIVFTSPFLPTPSLAGTRSHILPGKLSLGMWYEDNTNMYRVNSEQIEDVTAYFEKNMSFTIVEDYSLSTGGDHIKITGVSPTVNNSLFQQLKSRYGTTVAYSEIDTLGSSTITASGTDNDNLASMFLTGLTHNNTTTVSGVSETVNVPILYRVGFTDVSTNKYFKNEELYVEQVEVNRSKLVSATITRDAGWIGKRYGDTCYIDFEFSAPTRVCRVTFDDVVYQSNETTRYNVSAITDATWESRTHSISDDDATLSISYSDTWTEADGRWTSQATSEVVSGDGPSSIYTYGVKDVSIFSSDDYYDKFKVTNIKIHAKKELPDSWTVLYEGSFDGEAVFNQDDKFTYYRLYLVSAFNESCPECMELVKYNAVYPRSISVSGVAVSDVDSVTTVFGEDDIADAELFYMTSSGTDTVLVSYVGETHDDANDRADLNSFGQTHMYTETVDFDYDRTIESTDTISAGWSFSKSEDDSTVYLDFSFDTPRRITGLSLGQVVHSASRAITISYNNLNDATWASRTSTLTDSHGNDLNIAYEDSWALVGDDLVSNASSITSDYTGNSYLLCYGVPKNKQVSLDTVSNAYDVTKIKLQGYTGTAYVDLYEGFIDSLVYFNNTEYFDSYRLYILESTLYNFKKSVLESVGDNTTTDRADDVDRVWYESDISSEDLLIGEGYCMMTTHTDIDLPKEEVIISEAYLYLRAKFDSPCTTGFRVYLANTAVGNYNTSRTPWGSVYTSVDIDDWTSLTWYKIDITNTLRDLIDNERWVDDVSNNRFTVLNVLLRGNSESKVNGLSYYRAYGGYGETSTDNSPYIEVVWRTNEEQVGYKTKSPGYYTATVSGASSAGFANIFSNTDITTSNVERVSTIAGNKDVDVLFRAETENPHKLNGFGKNSLFYDKVNFDYTKTVTDNSNLEEGWVAKDTGASTFVDFVFDEPTRIVKISFDPVNHSYNRSIVTTYDTTTFSGGEYTLNGIPVTYGGTFTNSNGVWRCPIDSVSISGSVDGYGVCYGIHSTLTGDTTNYSDIYEVTSVRIEAYDGSDWDLLYDGVFDGEALFKHRNLYTIYRMYIRSPLNSTTGYKDSLPLRFVPPSKYTATGHNLTSDSTDQINRMFDRGKHVSGETFITTISGADTVNLVYSLEYGDDDPSQDFIYKRTHLEPIQFNFTKVITEVDSIDKGWIGKKTTSSPYILLSFDDPTRIKRIDFDPVVYSVARSIESELTSFNSMGDSSVYTDTYTGATIAITLSGSWSDSGGAWEYSSEEDSLSLANYGNNSIVYGKTYPLNYQTSESEEYDYTYNVTSIRILGLDSLDDISPTTVYDGTFSGTLSFSNDNSYKYYKLFLTGSSKTTCSGAYEPDEEIVSSLYSVVPLDGMSSDNYLSIFDTGSLIENREATTTLSGVRDVSVWCRREDDFSGPEYESSFRYMYKHTAPFTYVKEVTDVETLEAGYKSDNPFTFKVVFDTPTNVSAISMDDVTHTVSRQIDFEYIAPDYSVTTSSGHLDSMGGYDNTESHSVDIHFNQDWTKGIDDVWRCTISGVNTTSSGYCIDVCYGFRNSSATNMDSTSTFKYGASRIKVYASNDDVTYSTIYDGAFDGDISTGSSAEYLYYKIELDEPVYTNDLSGYVEAPTFTTVSGAPPVVNPSNNKYKPVNVRHNCTVSVTGADDVGIDGLFEREKICTDNVKSVVHRCNSVVPILFYINHSFSDADCSYRFTDTYVIRPEFEFDRTIHETETKDAGWVGRKISDVYLDFDFDEPTRIVRIDFDDVVYNGTKTTTYDYVGYNATTWTGTVYSFSDSNAFGDISADLNHASTFSLVRGNDYGVVCSGSDYTGCKWVNTVESVSNYFSSYTSSVTSEYDTWEYKCVGLDKYDAEEDTYSYRMGATRIKVVAGDDKEDMTTLYETGVTDNTIFEGTALFLHDNKYKYYRIYLLESCKDVCPGCLEANEYKVIPPNSIDITDLTSVDKPSHNVSSVFMDGILYDNSYISTPVSGTDTLTINDKFSRCYDYETGQYTTVSNYSRDFEFNYSLAKAASDTKDMGWFVDGNSGQIKLRLAEPYKLTRLTFDEVTHTREITRVKDFYSPVNPSLSITETGLSYTGYEYSDVFDKWYTMATINTGAITCATGDPSVAEFVSYGANRHITTVETDVNVYSATSMIIKGSNSDSDYVTVYSGTVNAGVPVNVTNIDEDYEYYTIELFTNNGTHAGVGMKGLVLEYNSCDKQFYDFGIRNLRMYDFISDGENPQGGYGISNFKLYKKKCITDYDYGISNFKIYESHYTPEFNFGIRNLKLFEYEFENNKEFGIRDLKLLEYECENDHKFGISNLKLYDFAPDATTGSGVLDYVVADNGCVEQLATNNVTIVDGDYALKVTGHTPLSYAGDVLQSGDTFYTYNSRSSMLGTNAVLFEVTGGECYNCRLTAWDDATHSTLINPIFTGDHCRVSAYAFYLKNTTTDTVILNPFTEANSVPIMAPVKNRIFKGDTVYSGTEYYYGDFDMLDRQGTGYRGDYLLFKPMLYGIDESMPYGVHDFLIVLHYSYT